MAYVCWVRIKHGLDTLSNRRVVSLVLAPVPVRAPVTSGVISVVSVAEHVCPKPTSRWPMVSAQFSVLGVHAAWWLHQPKL